VVEINNSDDLRKWLEDKPKEYSVVIAYRIALRVLPKLNQAFKDNNISDEILRSLTISIFRINLLSWVTYKYSYHDINNSAHAAARSSHYQADAAGAATNTTDAIFAAYAAYATEPAYVAAARINQSLHITTKSSDASDSASYSILGPDAFNSSFTAHDADIDLLEQGMKPKQLAKQPLWKGKTSPDANKEWQGLKNHLLALNENWGVWIGWYEDILAGRNWVGLPDDLVEQLSLKIAEQSDEWWEKDSAKINADIKKWRDELLPPKEPPLITGLTYQIRREKLSEIALLPEKNEFEAQAKVHEQIKKLAKNLAYKHNSLGNQFPALLNAASEYCDLVNNDIEKLDITAVWAVGGTLASFAQSYREQNIANTMGSPLEPDVEAELQALVRTHGAFILGFKEGQELVERADKFALTPEVISQIEKPANEVLKELTENDELVDEPTRKLHKPVSNALIDISWKASRRVSYTALSIINNSTKTIISFLLVAGSIQTISTMTGISSNHSKVSHNDD